MRFETLEEVLKGKRHYKIHYLSGMYGEWKVYREIFWDREEADNKVSKMRKNNRYQAVALTVSGETILDK